MMPGPQHAATMRAATALRHNARAFPPVHTPGHYLQLRRIAVRLTVAQVAQRLQTEPPLPEHDRAALVMAIETDAQPARFSTIAALRRVVPFSLDVLAALDSHAQGLLPDPPALCRFCGAAPGDACPFPTRPARSCAHPVNGMADVWVGAGAGKGQS